MQVRIERGRGVFQDLEGDMEIRGRPLDCPGVVTESALEEPREPIVPCPWVVCRRVAGQPA